LLLVTKSKTYYEVELKLKVKSTSKIKDHVKKCCEQFSGPCCNYAGRVERVVVFRNNDIASRAKSYYRNVSTCRFTIIALNEDDVRRHIR
jgi:ribosomal protein L19